MASLATSSYHLTYDFLDTNLIFCLNNRRTTGKDIAGASRSSVGVDHYLLLKTSNTPVGGINMPPPCTDHNKSDRYTLVLDVYQPIFRQ